MRKPKTHIVRNGVTACGRNATGLVASKILHAIPFVLHNALAREKIIAATTCIQCIRFRYSR